MKKVDAKMWRDACSSGKKAKRFLRDLTFENGARVLEVELASGLKIPVSKVTEEQALDFVMMLAPSWANVRGMNQ